MINITRYGPYLRFVRVLASDVFDICATNFRESAGGDGQCSDAVGHQRPHRLVAQVTDHFGIAHIGKTSVERRIKHVNVREHEDRARMVWLERIEEDVGNRGLG